MTAFRTQAYHSDGRMRGSYVYMLLCQDAPGPIYVKIGRSDVPTNRLLQLRRGCPVSPQRFAYCEVRSIKRAKLVEAELLSAMKKWRAHGEWFCLKPEDKPEFNLAWQVVFQTMSETGWRLKWEQLAAPKWFAAAAARKRFAERLFMRRGKSYQDFVRQST